MAGRGPVPPPNGRTGRPGGAPADVEEEHLAAVVELEPLVERPVRRAVRAQVEAGPGPGTAAKRRDRRPGCRRPVSGELAPERRVDDLPERLTPLARPAL